MAVGPTRAADPWSGAGGGATGPITGVVAATLSNTNEEAVEARALYVGAAGNVVVLLHDGTEVTLTALAAGVWHPIRVRRVNTTNTTATGVMLGY
jgi:hypothetical protein